MNWHALEQVDDELLTVMEREPRSFRRYESLQALVMNYDRMRLYESHIIIELGIAYPSGLHVVHFEMERSRGHLLAFVCSPVDILFLHFYVYPTDFVPEKRADEAHRRLKDYWGIN